MTEDDRPDRYEPLPGPLQLPGWLWHRAGRRARIGAGVALLVAAAVVVALVPGLRESKGEQDERERRARAAARAERVRELRREQRPVLGRSPSVVPAAASDALRLDARAALLDRLAEEVVADARRRVRAGTLEGPIRRVACEPFPRTEDGRGAEIDLDRRVGRYSWLAVTAKTRRTEETVGALIGHRYRVQVDFETGRYAFCQVSGQAGPSREALVTVPRACGG